MNRRSINGFTLVELVVAIVFVGVVLGPLLVFAARIHDLNNAIGQQSRHEAWRSFTDQAVAAGINPALAPALAANRNAAVPNLAPAAIEEETVAVQSGLPRIVPLRTEATLFPEPRVRSSGFQIGAGGVAPPRATPASPLVPIVMPMPTVSPVDGTVVAATDLNPGATGQPFTLNIQATAPLGTSVQLVLNQPHVVAAGSGAASHRVTAVDLLGQVNGSAWGEYPGDANADRAVMLPDGRTRWLVTTTERRLQIYEPSAFARFAYRIGLGTLVLRHELVEHPAGASLPFDYASYTEVQSGAASLQIDFPAAVRTAFGNTWSSQAIGYQWTFHQSAGPFDGDLRPFFSPDLIGTWSDSVTVAASAVLPVGAVAQAAAWTLTRRKTPLDVPSLSTAADSAGFFTAGALQFTAPSVGTFGPIGRLSFNHGAMVSTGTTLSVTVIP